MKSESSSANLKKSILAILAGFVFTVLTHLGTDAVMKSLGVLPKAGEPFTDALAALALGYRLVWALIGNVITARLAPNRPLFHCMLGAGIGILLGTLGTIATWNRGPEFGPHWYPIALILTSVPIAWLGAKIANPDA